MGDRVAESTTAEASRRDVLYIATGAFTAVGAAYAAWPFVSQLAPDAATIAAGAPVDVDISKIAEGQAIKLFWRGKLVFIRHRTKKEIDEARATDVATLKDRKNAADSERVKAGKDQWLVVYGNCTHLGCVPLGNGAGEPRGEYGGWFCPCHGSHYDTSGRIRKGPAPENLGVPDYTFLSDSKIKIG
jgi:ubiquinol-cytochrome c reductase iron-sulfur subunit